MKSVKSVFTDLRDRLSSFEIDRAANRDFDFTFTEQDLEQDLRREGSNRLLERFTENEVFEALKGYGVLEQLSQKGYADPRLVIRSLDPFRQSVKLLESTSSPEDEDHMLCELRVFDAHVKGLCPATGDTMEIDTLVIDWLIFQNPRAQFAPHRPQLPGQKYPGLGIMRSCMQAILGLARQTGKEAVINIPEYYHNAVLYTPAFHFFSPFVEGRFHALQEFLAGLSLAEASHAVSAGKIWNESKGEVFVWKPHEQLLGITDRVKNYFDSEEYEGPVKDAKAQSKFSWCEVQ
ncbi:hypothetical protein L0222_23780 [bacterium]|nr:hypothetical protein [bacterium]